MPIINTEDLTDGCAQTDKLTAKFRVEGTDGKMLFNKIIYLANILVQASAASGGDKTAWATVATFCATESNLDFILKKF